MFSTIKFSLLFIALLSLSYVSSSPTGKSKLKHGFTQVNPDDPFEAGDIFHFIKYSRPAIVLEVSEGRLMVLPLFISFRDREEKGAALPTHVKTAVAKLPKRFKWTGKEREFPYFYSGTRLYQLPDTEIRRDEEYYTLDDSALSELLQSLNLKDMEILDDARKPINPKAKDDFISGVSSYINAHPFIESEHIKTLAFPQLHGSPLRPGEFVYMTLPADGLLRAAIMVNVEDVTETWKTEGLNARSLATFLPLFVDADSSARERGTDIKGVTSLGRLSEALQGLPKSFRRGREFYSYLGMAMHVTPSGDIRKGQKRYRLDSDIKKLFLEHINSNIEEFIIQNRDGRDISKQAMPSLLSAISHYVSPHTSGSGSGLAQPAPAPLRSGKQSSSNRPAPYSLNVLPSSSSSTPGQSRARSSKHRDDHFAPAPPAIDAPPNHSPLSIERQIGRTGPVGPSNYDGASYSFSPPNHPPPGYRFQRGNVIKLRLSGEKDEHLPRLLVLDDLAEQYVVVSVTGISFQQDSMREYKGFVREWVSTWVDRQRFWVPHNEPAELCEYTPLSVEDLNSIDHWTISATSPGARMDETSMALGHQPASGHQPTYTYPRGYFK